MNDDQMDDRIIQSARSYHEPGPVPREEIWARVSAARRAHGGAVPEAAPADAGGLTSARTVRRVRRWAPIGVAAAALLVIGVGIGRLLERQRARSGPPASLGAPAVAQRSDSVPPALTGGVARAGGVDSLIDQLQRETQSTQRQARALASAHPPTVADPRRERAEPSLAYHLVVLRHLAGSDAMITAFRSSAERGEVDAQIAAWSRELLSTTRMLEASPATTDPTLKRLLEDLDLVIVQIARYTSRGTNNPEDLDLIERSIDKRGVIAKLRSPLPRPIPRSRRNAPAGT